MWPFKTKVITIPVDNSQSVTELESWTVRWTAYLHDFSNHGIRRTFHKVFIKELEADEFIKQLKESAKFLNTDITTNKTKNGRTVSTHKTVEVAPFMKKILDKLKRK